MTFTSRTGTSLSQFEYWHKPQTILILFQNVKVPIFRAYEAVQISFENTLKNSKYYHWFYSFIPSQHIPNWIPKIPANLFPFTYQWGQRGKEGDYYLETETQWRAKPQTYTSMKIKVSPDKVGQISLMWGCWMVSLTHSLVNTKHQKKINFIINRIIAGCLSLIKYNFCYLIQLLQTEFYDIWLWIKHFNTKFETAVCGCTYHSLYQDI